MFSIRRISAHLHAPSPAIIIALLALFVAIGGTTYAAIKLPKNSVGSKQLKKDSVTSAKVKNNSLQQADFIGGHLPAGPTGPPGPAGSDGSALGYTNLNYDGTVVPQASKNINNSNVSWVSSTGTFCFHDLPFTVGGISATPDTATNYVEIARAATKSGDPAVFSGGGPCGDVNNAQAAVQLAAWTGSGWVLVPDTVYVAFF